MSRRSCSAKCGARIMRFNNIIVLSLLLFIVILPNCYGFNLDVNHPLTFTSSKPSSTFGYSVGLINSKRTGNVLLVGAPTDNSTFDASVQSGVIYACGLSTSCNELGLQQRKDPIIRFGDSYVELRDGSWLGVAIDVSPDGSQFVACGHLWKDQQYAAKPEDALYVTNGICYLGSMDLDMSNVRRLLPLVKRGQQTYETQYIYALGLSGFSAHFGRDGQTLLMGAPGAYRLSGTVTAVNYTGLLASTFTPDYRVFIPNDDRSPDSYFGYSIASGKFLNDSKYYFASGAPREGPNGIVYIFSLPEEFIAPVDVKLQREGSQMGEYFGGSLCSSDFNADGLDDLVVGAPLHSMDIEEGLVYVYSSEGLNLRTNPIFLKGSSALMGRFGSVVTAIGDLNLDGFNDLAVGAPYEGNGVVYIFHGSSSGLGKKFVQRIAASDINVQLKGFGMSISRSRDIDNNFYPDLAVGAPLSSQAVILRAKPIVRMSGSVTFSISHINTDIKNCTIVGGELVTCFHAELCSMYSGQHAPANFDIQTIVSIDQQLKRVQIYENGRTFSEFDFNSTFSSVRPNCRSFTFILKKDVQDFLSVVPFSATHVLLPSLLRSEFCSTCPAIDTSQTGDIKKSLPFFTGCGDDDKCISDLQLDAKFSKYGPEDVLVLGTEDTLQLSFSVTNRKEPAFQALLRLSIPPDVDFGRIPSECSVMSTSNVTCLLGNPLVSNREVLLDFILDLKRLMSAEMLVFDATVNTASGELTDDLNDNSKSLQLPVKTVTGVSLSGWTFYEQQFVYNRSDPGFVPLIHLHQITKTEPSPIKELSFEFKFPISTKNRESFVQHLSINVLYNYVPISADRCVTMVGPPNSPFQTVNHEDTEHGRAAVVDCDSMACHVLQCKFGPFTKRDTITVNISATIDLSTIVQRIMPGEGIVILRSFGMVNVEGAISHSVVKTVFVSQDLVPQSAGAAWWIYLLAILGGILLLALLIFALYKFGFFQRKRPENLLEEEKEDEHLSERPEDDED